MLLKVTDTIWSIATIVHHFFLFFGTRVHSLQPKKVLSRQVVMSSMRRALVFTPSFSPILPEFVIY